MVWLRRTALGLAMGLTAGCLGRSLPVPPPGLTAQAITECDRATCPNGGVILTLSGTADPGAEVIAEDTSPAAQGSAGELLAAAARTSADGRWELTLAPQRDTGGHLRAVQRGDTVNIYQITPAPESRVSMGHDIVVPRR